MVENKVTEKKITEKKITVEKYRSDAGRTKRVKAVMAALGLKKIGDQRELPENPAVLGMLKKVEHLVRVKKV